MRPRNRSAFTAALATGGAASRSDDEVPEPIRNDTVESPRRAPAKPPTQMAAHVAGGIVITVASIELDEGGSVRIVARIDPDDTRSPRRLVVFSAFGAALAAVAGDGMSPRSASVSPSLSPAMLPVSSKSMACRRKAAEQREGGGGCGRDENSGGCASQAWGPGCRLAVGSYAGFGSEQCPSQHLNNLLHWKGMWNKILRPGNLLSGGGQVQTNVFYAAGLLGAVKCPDPSP